MAPFLDDRQSTLSRYHAHSHSHSHLSSTCIPLKNLVVKQSFVQLNDLYIIQRSR